MTAPVEVGQVLAGKYRVERVLGEGGMGVVVAAFDTTLERRVALKFLLPRYVEHHEASARFMREARAAVKIKSEHIARVIDVSTMENGAPYIVMEYLDGHDLSEELTQRGQLPLEEAVGYILQAADAIAEAHACGVVHRDLKPANLFLAHQPDGTRKVKVLDFGISKNTLGVGDDVDQSLTCTTSVMGSPLYMSPEQMRSTKSCDSRTDVWALGVILYEMLEGQLPFQGNSLPELSAGILLGPPRPPTRADVPQRVQLAVARALEKAPGDRFATVGEFVQHLSGSAPKHLRETLKRISRVQLSAGLVTGPLALPPSLAPAGSLSETAAALPPIIEPQRSAPVTVDVQAQQVLTHSNWGQTAGPVVVPVHSHSRWLLPALGVLAGGAAVFAFVTFGPQRNDPTSVAGDPPSAPATPSAAQPAAPQLAAAAEAEDEARRSAVVASGDAPKAESSAEPQQVPVDVASPSAAPPPTDNDSPPAASSETAPDSPPTKKPKVRPTKPVEHDPKPPPAKKETGSFKPKYGGRK